MSCPSSGARVSDEASCCTGQRQRENDAPATRTALLGARRLCDIERHSPPPHAVEEWGRGMSSDAYGRSERGMTLGEVSDPVKWQPCRHPQGRPRRLIQWERPATTVRGSVTENLSARIVWQSVGGDPNNTKRSVLGKKGGPPAGAAPSVFSTGGHSALGTRQKAVPHFFRDNTASVPYLKYTLEIEYTL